MNAAPSPAQSQEPPRADLRERIVALETMIKYMATKEDLADRESKTMKWLVGVMLAAAAATVAALIRTYS